MPRLWQCGILAASAPCSGHFPSLPAPELLPWSRPCGVSRAAAPRFRSVPAPALPQPHGARTLAGQAGICSRGLSGHSLGLPTVTVLPNPESRQHCPVQPGPYSAILASLRSQPLQLPPSRPSSSLSPPAPADQGPARRTAGREDDF